MKFVILLMRKSAIIFDSSAKICVPVKTKDVNLVLFNVNVLKINESKSLVNQPLCNYKCRFESKNVT